MGCVSGRYWCGTGRMQRWITDFSHSGGQIVEQATHMIDMMRYLVGEIDEVLCYQAKRILTSGNCPDSNAVAIRFSNGVVGTLNATWAGDPDDWSQANILNIFFDNHRLEWKAEAIEVTPPLESEVASASAPGSAPSPHAIERTFLDAMKRNDSSEILSDYEDGVRSLAVSVAANVSAREGKPVTVAQWMTRPELCRFLTCGFDPVCDWLTLQKLLNLLDDQAV